VSAGSDAITGLVGCRPVADICAHLDVLTAAADGRVTLGVGVEAGMRPRDHFRVLRAQRGGYDAVMFDVQLQVVRTGALVWAQSFSDERQADDFYEVVAADLDELEMAAFRSKYGVPSTT
jgi:hypothetical protein